MNATINGSTLPPSAARPRVALFGLDCAFSVIVLRGLVEHGFPVAGVYLAGPRSHAGLIPRPPVDGKLPLHADAGRPPGMRATAGKLGVPLFLAGDLRAAETQQAITAQPADLACCACFSQLVPPSLYERFPLGGLNLHPSLLPDLRGPDPGFWTFRRGEGQSGLTIHRLDAHFDTGAILAQQSFQLSDGALESEWERRAADLGVALLAELLPRLAAGGAEEQAQDERGATHARWPHRRDFLIDRARPARVAFNFVQGLSERGHPFYAELDGELYRLRPPFAYGTDQTDAPAGEDVGAIPCNPGLLFARLLPAATDDLAIIRAT